MTTINERHAAAGIKSVDIPTQEPITDSGWIRRSLTAEQMDASTVVVGVAEAREGEDGTMIDLEYIEEVAAELDSLMCVRNTIDKQIRGLLEEAWAAGISHAELMCEIDRQRATVPPCAK